MKLYDLGKTKDVQPPEEEPWDFPSKEWNKMMRERRRKRHDLILNLLSLLTGAIGLTTFLIWLLK